MKRFAAILCLACALPAFASAGQPSYPTVDTTPAPLGNLTPSDLTFDPAFGNSGIVNPDFNDTDGKDDLARRVFRANDPGYWTAGYHRGPDVTNDGIAIARLDDAGNYDLDYNGTGKKTLPSPLYEILDVAKGANDTLFFAGTIRNSATDADFGIYCVDSTGDPCQGFGIAGLVEYAIDLGANAQYYDDRPQRIVAYASALYIVGDSVDGNSASNAHTVISMIKIAQSDGAQDVGFGNTPGRPGLFTWNVSYVTNGDSHAYDLIAWSPELFQVRLALVGEADSSSSATDSDGFIAVIDGISGGFDNSFAGDGRSRIAYDLGTTFQDGARRVLRLANGRLVVAGYATNDGIDELTLSRFLPTGVADSSFGDQGQLHQNAGSSRNVPFGLGENPRNRDLVVGVNILDDLFGDGHPLQAFKTFSASGRTQHAFNVLDSTAFDPASRSSIGTGLIMDGTRTVGSGQRAWNPASSDYDFTAVRFIATDSIFASQFGTSQSD